MIATDFDEMQARMQELQQKSAEVRHAEPELAPPITAELQTTHEAVADLNLGVEHQLDYQPGQQLETNYGTPPVDFAENPLIVDQQISTHQSALGAIQ